jgi:cytoskeletal protein CcmA (bactofilin family)
MSVFNKKMKTDTDPKLATIISEGCLIEGTISGEGSVRIDGQVMGDLNVRQHVIVGSKGVVTGNVTTAEMTLFGTVKGNVSSSVLEIRAGGNINGDITTSQMSIELGGIHNGSVSMKETRKAIMENKKEAALQ